MNLEELVLLDDLARSMEKAARRETLLVTPKAKHPVIEIWEPDQTATLAPGKRGVIFNFEIDKTQYGVVRKISNFPTYSNAGTTGIADEFYWYVDQISQFSKPITICLGEPNTPATVLKFFRHQSRWEAKNNGSVDHKYRVTNFGKVSHIEDRDVLEELASRGVF